MGLMSESGREGINLRFNHESMCVEQRVDGGRGAGKGRCKLWEELWELARSLGSVRPPEVLGSVGVHHVSDASAVVEQVTGGHHKVEGVVVLLDRLHVERVDWELLRHERVLGVPDLVIVVAFSAGPNALRASHDHDP